MPRPKLPNVSQEMIRKLARLPGEEQVDRLLNRAASVIERTTILSKLESIRRRAPSMRAFRIPTPLGQVETPELSLPNVQLPVMNERRRNAVKAAAAVDLSMIISFIPVFGDFVADVVEDIYGHRIREVLTPEELTRYMERDKIGPSAVAMLRTFAEVRQ